jgi:hypothetical protein
MVSACAPMRDMCLGDFGVVLERQNAVPRDILKCRSRRGRPQPRTASPREAQGDEQQPRLPGGAAIRLSYFLLRLSGKTRASDKNRPGQPLIGGCLARDFLTELYQFGAVESPN